MSKLMAVEKAFSKWDESRKKADGDYAVLSDGRAVTQKDDEWMLVDRLVIMGSILRAKVDSNGI